MARRVYRRTRSPDAASSRSGSQRTAQQPTPGLTVPRRRARTSMWGVRARSDRARATGRPPRAREEQDSERGAGYGTPRCHRCEPTQPPTTSTSRGGTTGIGSGDEGISETVAVGDWSEAATLELAYIHPAAARRWPSAKRWESPDKSSSNFEAALQPSWCVWGIMPNGMLRHPLFLRWLV